MRKVLSEEEAQSVCGKVKTLDCLLMAWSSASPETKISLTEALRTTAKEICDLFAD